MKETRTVGRTVDIEVKMYDLCKYARESYENKELRHVQKNVISWDILTGEDVEEIESNLNNEEMDELHEYIRLNFEDGSEATYRNSHCDIFIY
jgi:hypothetical protein